MINGTAVRELCSLSLVGMLLFTLTFAASRAIAQAHEDAPAPTGASAAHTPTESHAADDRPVVPTDAAAWAGTLLIIILAMFLMAAVIGPMVRLEVPAESHDDHHGHDDHGHGHADHSHGH